MLNRFFPSLFHGKQILATRIHEHDSSFKLMNDICKENYNKEYYAIYLHDYLCLEDEVWDIEDSTGFKQIYDNLDIREFSCNMHEQIELEHCLREWIEYEKEYFKLEYAELIANREIHLSDFQEITREIQGFLYTTDGSKGEEFSILNWFSMISRFDNSVVDEDMHYYLNYIDNYYNMFATENSQKRYEEETFQGFKSDNPNILKRFSPNEDKTLKVMRGAFNFNIERAEPNIWKFKEYVISI